jgi:hypothetical protein
MLDPRDCCGTTPDCHHLDTCPTNSDQRDYRIRFYERQAARLVAHLHSLADEVERAARPSAGPGVTRTPRFLAAAERVNHALAWGIANAGAYALTESAYHADAAEVDQPTSPLRELIQEEA